MAKKAAAKPKTSKPKKAGKADNSKKAGAAKGASKADDFRARTGDELNTQLTGLKKEQFNLRFQRANGQAENTGRIRVLRRDIARIQTILNEQRRSSAKA
jgi:large subunit ribosomal protein L29